MKYLSLDIETLGLDRKCSVLEVAFVEEDTERPDVPVNELPYSRVLFRPVPMIAEPYALQMHMDSGLLGECMEHGEPTHAAWAHVKSDLRRCVLHPHVRAGGSKGIVIAGKNVAGFDLAFFPDDIKCHFHYRTIDPGSLFLDLADDAPRGLPHLLRHCGESDTVSHRALDDARDTIRVIRYGLARLKSLDPTRQIAEH